MSTRLEASIVALEGSVAYSVVLVPVPSVGRSRIVEGFLCESC